MSISYFSDNWCPAINFLYAATIANFDFKVLTLLLNVFIVTDTQKVGTPCRVQGTNVVYMS